MAEKARGSHRFALPFLFFALIGPVLTVIYWPTLATLEGKYFPVVSGVRVLSAGGIPEGRLSFWEFEKVRDCDFLDLTFYEGRRGERFSIITTDFNPDGGIDTSRPTGENVAGPWLHYTTSPPENWFSDVRHRCHPLWITRTRFWN